MSILLVEDDEKDCQKIKQYTEELDDISLIGITNNLDGAICYTKEFLPEAIILDLELHKGGGNGLSFLCELKKLELPYHPFVLVTTNNCSDITYECARENGADFIMAKYQSDYSPEGAVDFLRMMKTAIFSKIQSLSPEHETSESPEQKEKRIVSEIHREFDLVGMNPKHVGYRYLTEAVQLVLDKPVHNLCSILGARFGKTDVSIERAMQNAINKAWRTSDIEDLLKYYTAHINAEKGTPTITEFIYYYADKIKNRY